MTDTRSTGGVPESSDDCAPDGEGHRGLAARLQVDEQTEDRRDELFDALSAPRRRRVVEYVEANERATLRQLAEHVAECESPDRPGLRSVELTLHHSHVPRLVDAGLLAYGDDKHHLRRGDRLDAAPALE